MLVFPYYSAYNTYRADRPLCLTDAEMEDKIKQHLDSLKDNRSRDLQRWIGQIQESIESRITLNKLNALIDQARQNKYEVPDTIRDQIDRATKCGKELKKLSQNKQSLDKLKARKEALADQKIITNDMINFEEAINRCEDWIVRANAFEEQHFQPQKAEDSPERKLKPSLEKIDFKQMHILVQEYNSLPIQHQGFEANTRKLHESTLALVERLPQFTKVAKTRTSNTSKASLGSIKKLLAEIDRHVVLHEDFIFFREQVCEAMELLQRISMFLEDDRAEKTTKLMNNYLKLVNDLPILSNLPSRLENFIEYYTLIERIKKDIINPNRFEQTQDLISEALTKGFCSAELIEYESKLKVYRGWFRSAELLTSTERNRRLVDLIKDEATIISNMVDQTAFKAQLHHARTELNIDELDLGQYEKRFEQIDQQKHLIRALLVKAEPDMGEMVTTLVVSIRDSIKYQEFMSLYSRVNYIVTVLVKVVALMEFYNFTAVQAENGLTNSQPFLKKAEYEELLPIVSNRRQIREICKADAQALREDTKPFPRNLPEWLLFCRFLDVSENWQNEALTFLREYRETGDADDLTLDRLLVASENVVTDKAVLDQLTEVHQIIRWKYVLDQKLSEQPPIRLTEGQLAELATLNLHLGNLAESAAESDFKHLSLDFAYTHRQRIYSLLEVVSLAAVDKTQKLHELGRMLREVDKITVRDAQLDRLKRELEDEIKRCESWKDKYIGLRKLDIRKREEDKDEEEESPIKENSCLNYYCYSRKKEKYPFKSPEYSYFFKLPLLISEFFAGCQLQIQLDELAKLRNYLQEVHRFIRGYLNLAEEPTAAEVLALETDGNKLNLFFLEMWMTEKRSRYVQSWRAMAVRVIDSVPILKLEEVYKEVAAVEESKNNASRSPTKRKAEPLPVNQSPAATRKPELSAVCLPMSLPVLPMDPPKSLDPTVDMPAKRIRRQNPHYNNSEIITFSNSQDMFYFCNPKKKKKVGSAAVLPTPQEVVVVADKKKPSQLKGKGSAGPLDAYCICRKGLMNEASFMLMCESCNQWFHIECVAIRKSYIRNVEHYYCVACCERDQKHPVYLNNYYWASRRKLNETEFMTLLQEGRELGVQLEELAKLEIIEGRIRKWKAAVERLIEQEGDRKKRAHELYLESYWLPTLFLETEVIRRLAGYEVQ